MRIGGVIIAGGLLAGCIPSIDVPAETAEATPPPQAVEYERRSVDEEVTQLPAPPPAWEARTVVPDARLVAAQSYTVRAGDTLRMVAERSGAGSEAIARANTLSRPYTLRPGQTLTIPGGRYHLVKAGESGIAIARAYATDWSGVVSANDLAAPYILRVGQRVLIPGGASSERPAQLSAAQRAAAFRLDIDDILTGGEPALARNEAPSRPIASSARALPSTAAVVPPLAAPGAFMWPVKGNLLRRYGAGASGERNDGIKIGIPLGTPILAAADGVVAYVGKDIPALGGLVILKHGGTLTSVYGHASQLLVQRGQSVKRGQAIALSGNTGFADRPELHFEIRQGRTPVDPLSKLPPR